MKTGIKIRVKFWATKCGYKWNNNKMRILNNKLLRIEDELGELRTWLFENFTDYKKRRVKKRRKRFNR